MYTLVSLFLEQKKFQEASTYYSTALEMSQMGFGKDSKRTLVYNLSKAYEGLGDSAKAFMYLRQWASQTDSLHRIENAKLVAEIEGKYYAKQQEREIDRLGEDKAAATGNDSLPELLRNNSPGAPRFHLFLISVQ